MPNLERTFELPCKHIVLLFTVKLEQPTIAILEVVYRAAVSETASEWVDFLLTRPIPLIAAADKDQCNYERKRKDDDEKPGYRKLVHGMAQSDWPNRWR